MNSLGPQGTSSFLKLDIQPSDNSKPEKIDALKEIRVVANSFSWDPAKGVLNVIHLYYDDLVQEDKPSNGELPLNLRKALVVYIQVKNGETVAVEQNDDDAKREDAILANADEMNNALMDLKSLNGSVLLQIPEDISISHWLSMTTNTLLSMTCRQHYAAHNRYCQKKLDELKKNGVDLPYTDRFNLDKKFAQQEISRHFYGLIQAGFPNTYQEIIRKLKSGALENMDAAVKYARELKNNVANGFMQISEKLVHVIRSSVNIIRPIPLIPFNPLMQGVEENQNNRPYNVTWNPDDFTRNPKNFTWTPKKPEDGWKGKPPKKPEDVWKGKHSVNHDATLEVACILDGILTEEHLNQLERSKNFPNFHKALNAPIIKEMLIRGELEIGEIVHVSDECACFVHEVKKINELYNKGILNKGNILNITIDQLILFRKSAVVTSELLKKRYTFEEICELDKMTKGNFIKFLVRPSMTETVLDRLSKIPMNQKLKLNWSVWGDEITEYLSFEANPDINKFLDARDKCIIS